MGSLNRVLDYFSRRRATQFAEDAREWHSACEKVLQLCEQALNDRDLIQGDIGVVLDEADRTLFHLRGVMGGVRRMLRRDHPPLSRRVAQASERIFRLRNMTSRFLILSQGPGPMVAGDDLISQSTRETYYLRALEKHGFEARRIHAQAKQELPAIWADIEPLLARVNGSD
jgi:hypothetical protein